MTGFTIITLLTLLDAGDATPMCELRALVDAVVKRPLSTEEERLRQFWCEYQKAVREASSNIDWVQYYRGHGYQLDAQGRVICNPVIMNPVMQWAVPNSTPTGVPPHVYGQIVLVQPEMEDRKV